MGPDDRQEIRRRGPGEERNDGVCVEALHGTVLVRILRHHRELLFRAPGVVLRWEFGFEAEATRARGLQGLLGEATAEWHGLGDHIRISHHGFEARKGCRPLCVDVLSGYVCGGNVLAQLIAHEIGTDEGVAPTCRVLMPSVRKISAREFAPQIDVAATGALSYWV